MRKTLVALLPLAFVGAVAIGLVNCGSTGGDPAGTGEQFVNQSCNPDSSCLRLSVTRTVVVGETGTFSARLLDGSGNPIAGVEICFTIENGAGTIEDPASGCGLTDGSGGVSGTYRANQEGSHQFIARAPSGFGLESRATVVFTEPEACSTTGCGSNQFCAEGGGPCNFPDETCVALRRDGECCEADIQCIGDSECQGGTCASPVCADTGEPCNSDSDCCSDNCVIGPPNECGP